MKNNKLSLVRETILPLSSDDLSQVAGGGITDALRSKPQGSIAGMTDHIKSCGPLPRPTATITSGPISGVSRQVSGASNAF